MTLPISDPQVAARVLKHIAEGTTDTGAEVWREPVANYCSQERLDREIHGMLAHKDNSQDYRVNSRIRGRLATGRLEPGRTYCLRCDKCGKSSYFSQHCFCHCN